MTVRYYKLLNGLALGKTDDQDDYGYLIFNLETGGWDPSTVVFDALNGITGSADFEELSPEQATQLANQLATEYQEAR